MAAAPLLWKQPGREPYTRESINLEATKGTYLSIYLSIFLSFYLYIYIYIYVIVVVSVDNACFI